MPKPKSKAMFRFLQAVKHGTARDAHGLSPQQAAEGLSEFKGSYRSLPERKGSRGRKHNLAPR